MPELTVLPYMRLRALFEPEAWPAWRGFSEAADEAETAAAFQDQLDRATRVTGAALASAGGPLPYLVGRRKGR